MKTLVRSLAAILILSVAAFGQFLPQNASPVAHQGGTYYASAFFQAEGRVLSGNTSTGSQSIIIVPNGSGGIGGVTLHDGTVLPLQNMFNTGNPLIIDYGQANQETVTPTAVSIGSCPAGNLGVGSAVQCATITGTFSNTHGQSAVVRDGGFGVGLASSFANNIGGGVVVVDSVWTQLGGTDATLTAAAPYGNVSIEDLRAGASQFWTPAQTTSTLLAAPATLVNATAGFSVAGANLTGGTYTGSSSYITCIAYVDVMGNEGPCSATFTIATSGSASTDQIGYTAPAASTGAVGYTIYISLAGGTYNLTYQVPLTSTVCTLTKIETVTPACAVTNATYGQTGSAAIVSALTVNTAPLHLLVTTASTTSAYIGTPSGRTTYAYAPTGTLNGSGLTATQQAYTVAAATATTVPGVIATIPVPIGSMNKVGRTLCIAGQATEASAGSTATVQNIEFLWDAAGSDTAGAPVIIGQEQLTATLVTANADFWNFQGCFQATIVGAGVTAGTVRDIDGRVVSTYGAGVLGNTGTDVLGAVGSLNLAGTGGNTQRIHVVWLHTTGTDAAGVQVTGLRAWWQ
jgi:hypothetical protein